MNAPVVLTAKPTDAADVRVGDLVWFLGKAHLVSEIETTPVAHDASCAPDCAGDEIRIAVEAATGWRFALWPGQAIEVLR